MRYYDSNILRLPEDTRKKYHGQVDNLISVLSKKLRDQVGIKITKIVKAGSFAKHTILRKTSENPVDVDVVFYISGHNTSQENLDSLSEIIYDLLTKIYPQKEVEDFIIERKAATVEFKGSGLSVDIVPVIQDPSRPEYGWHFNKNGLKVEACAPCQIKFVRDRKDRDNDFRTLVRLAKKWRNYSELKPLKSFTIELIMAHLLDTEGKDGTIEQKFRRFLHYIADSDLKKAIKFAENKQPFKEFKDPVIILDPVSSENNVASRITDEERSEIVRTADKAWETASFASAKNNLEIWKELFGKGFKVE